MITKNFWGASPPAPPLTVARSARSWAPWPNPESAPNCHGLTGFLMLPTVLNLIYPANLLGKRGMSRTTSVVYRRLAGMIAENSAQTFSKTMNLIRTQLSFALQRSAIMCVRGSRTTKRTIPDLPTDLITVESRLGPR